MPHTLPSSSRCAATGGVRHTFCFNTESSASSAIDDQAAFVNSSRQDEDTAASLFKDNRTSSPRSPEVVSALEDEPTWDGVCVDMANGYHNGAGSSGSMCRICHEGDQKAELVSPCGCSGTMGFVHLSCIEELLNEKNVDFCELCGERFQMAAQPLTALRLFRRVWRNKKWRWRSLRFDLLCLVIVILVIVSVCALLAILEVNGEGVPWAIGFYYFMSIVLLVAYVVHTLNSLRTRYRYFLA
ncbi:hypothetical protein MTO96_018158 [Rhipicephalus appendiculatus]